MRDSPRFLPARVAFMIRLPRIAVISALAVGLVSTGCSRRAFRERTDRDVEALISQKNVMPQAQVQNWHVYPDPRARFADPTCPDFPPYPPDDYATKVLTPNPQRPGRGGVGRVEGDGYLKQLIEWDTQNRTEDDANSAVDGQTAPANVRGQIPSPDSSAPPGNPAAGAPPVGGPSAATTAAEAAAEAYRMALSSQERGYRIRLDQAVELALYNSREFQDRREDLYLAALPVSLERFGFSAQAFAATNVLYQVAGRETTAPGSRWQVNTNTGLTRNFSTGATLLVQLANQVVVDLSNGRPTLSTGTLGLSLVQPLLRGGGFAVTLEALTQAERNLVYAIRSYARFRSQFYVAIAGQGDYTNNPYGLQGLAQNLGRGIGANLTANPVGYLPTVLRSAILANEKNNVATFEQYQKLYQNLEEGGVVTKLQVGRIEQQLLQGRTVVLLRTQEYIDNIDNFKLQLGIPATIPLELDETPLRPIRDQLRRIEEVYQQFLALEKLAGKFDPTEAAVAYRDRWKKLFAESPLVKDTLLAKEFPKQSEELRSKSNDELDKLTRELTGKRRKLQDDRAAKLDKGQSADPENRELEVLEAQLDMIFFEQSLRRYESRPWADEPDQKKREGEQASVFRGALNAGMLVAVQARNQRLADIRGRWPKLPPLMVDDQDLIRVPLDVAYEKVASAALNNRLDLMNARAQVVDAWRQVAIRANALQGIFDVEYDLNTSSPTGQNRPFGLGGSRTLHQVRMRIEPPFVRRAERNLYRAALVAYQRQRRNLMAFEDNIVTDTRTDLRLLRQLEQTFMVQQRAVELAYVQVDNARGTLLAPPDPRAADPSASAASQTEQLLQVQAALVRAQNDLYTTWVRYLNARMNLYLDLELVPLDSRGIWSDEPSCPPAAPTSTSPASTAGIPTTPAGSAATDPWVPGSRRIDGGPVRPTDRSGSPVHRIEPVSIPTTLPPDFAPVPAVPPLSLPNSDATQPHAHDRTHSPSRTDGERSDPFPPIELPLVPTPGDAEWRPAQSGR
jgi:hypothetical protein